MTQTVLLGDLLTDLAMGPFGSNLKVDNFIESGVPVVKGGNLYGYEVGGDFSFVSEEKAQSLKRSLAYPDDIIITHRGTLGQVSIVPHGKYPYYLASQSQLRMTPDKNKINPRYLLYYLRSSIGQYELMQHAAQVGVPSIATPTKAVKSFKILLPDLESQQKIADILGAIDEKIELNRRMNETLEQMGQALFRHYFITNPEAEKWETGRIGNIAEVTDYVANGSFASLKENVTLYDTEEYALYVRTTDYKNGFSRNLKYVDRKSYDFLKKSSLDGSEFIISNVGDVGTVFKAPVWLNKPMTLASNVIMVRDSIYNNYLYLYFRGADGQFALSNITAGSAQPKFNKTEFRNLKIKLPDENSLSNFNVAYNVMSEQLANLNAEIQTLTTLRDTLLPRLISGKVKL